ncbi:MAG: polyprenyl synthetase family protein [Pseudomonadota bacterium]
MKRDLKAEIERDLELALAGPLQAPCPPRLADATRHAVLGGGSRVRPLVCLGVFQAAATHTGDGDLARAAATALELLHCASLVHDDLPCFDDADLRRGKPTCHVVHGEPLAVLAGDGLIVLALQSLARVAFQCGPDGARVFDVVSGAVAPPHGIVAGQAWESEVDVDLAAYHRAKTGALFVAAAEAGAIAAGSDDPRWAKFGARLGEAYQVADDLKDRLLDAAALGKDAGQDARHDRPNAVADFGIEGAQIRLKTILADAIALAGRDEPGKPLVALVQALAAKVMPREMLPITSETAPSAEGHAHARRHSSPAKACREPDGREPGHTAAPGAKAVSL